MTYRETLQYLYNLTKHGIKLGLKNTQNLLRILGNPEKQFNSIHIAGTNGKGSTARMLAKLLEASGYKTALFTSPHLVSFTERISINEAEITEEDVVRITGRIRDAIKDIGDLQPTFFEFITALAFYYFAENSVQWAVVETGMGGRFDATNVLMPEASVITDIGMDHSEFLGDSLEKIAFEKAGIMKESVPVITTSQKEEAMDVLKRRAEETGSKLYVYQRDFFTENETEDRGPYFDFYSKRPFEFTLKDIGLPIYGRHQIRNAALSLETLLVVSDPVRPEPEVIIKALSDVRFPGRSDIRRINQRDVMFDGAHNQDASMALSRTLRGLIDSGVYESVVLVLGVMADKDIRGIIEPLVEVSDTLILTRASYERSASVQRLKETLSEIVGANGNLKVNTIQTDTVEEALKEAERLTGERDLIVVTGSFYTAGEALEVCGYRAVLGDLREVR